MPVVEVDGASLHYEVAGAGPALAFVHGAGGSALSWWQQVPVFARRFRVVTYDQRGFGRSRCDPATRHPRRLAGDLAAVLEAAGVERAAIACQSLGGWAGLPFALARQERTAALVLCGTPGGLLTPRVLEDLAGVPERRAARPGFGGMALAPGFEARDPARAFLYEQIAAANPPDTVDVYGRGLGAVRVRPEELTGFRVPTLVLGGAHDLFFSPAGLCEVAATIPGARFRRVEEAGHSPYWEQPAVFNAEVTGFLEEVAAWGSSS
jgi:pimeloyl-ACP methyl ester carboxylesterase